MFQKNILFFLLTITGLSVFAGDRDFTYVYQSSTEERHEHELEIWFTYLDGGKSLNNYLSHRAEFEIGLTDRLQTSFYLNLDHHAFESTAITGFDLQTNTLISSPIIQKDVSITFSNEWKYNITDAESSLIGSALYAEFSIGPDKTEWEGKFILDKKIGNLILALNATGELEYTSTYENYFSPLDGSIYKELVKEKEKVAELSFGASYDFADHFSGGLEFFGTNAFVEGAENELSISAGPVAMFSAEDWWIAFTAMPNLYTSEMGEEDGRSFQTRLLFSYEF